MEALKEFLRAHYDVYVSSEYKGINYKASAVPKSVDEAPVDPVLSLESSSTLHAIANGLITACEVENKAYFACKSDNRNPEKCVSQALDCRKCALNLAHQYLAACPKELAFASACLSEKDNQFAECYQPRVLLENCMRAKTDIKFNFEPVNPEI